MMNKLTLIGGAPLTGKTSLSIKLAAKDNAVVISTDDIRSWMIKITNRNEYPDLFYAEGLSATNFYKKYDTALSVMNGEIKQGVQVERGVLALLETQITWDHLIIEGIALSPQFMKFISTKHSDRDINSIVLVDEDPARMESRIRERGLWGPLDSYPRTLIPKEVEWVILYNKWFKDKALESHIDIVYC